MNTYKKTLRWLLVVAVLATGLLLPRWLASRSRTEAPSQSQQQQIRIPVQVETVARSLLEQRLITTGTVLANEQVDIVSEIDGKVEEILFSEGSRVQKGSILIRLDTATLKAERDRALYRYERAQGQEGRQRRLHDDGLLSQEEYDFSLGELNVLRAELELRTAELAKAEIRAPFAGVVGLRAVSPGTFVSSQTRVTSLQDIDPVKIEFSVPESYAGDLSVDDTVYFSIQTVDQPVAGTVYAIEPAIDPESRSLTLRAKAPNPDRQLLPGAFAQVAIAVRQVPDAMSVPSIAVIPELGGKKVFVLQDGTAEPRIVETGIRTDTRVEITRGLETGEQVIVSNIPRLVRGVAVEEVDP